MASYLQYGFEEVEVPEDRFVQLMVQSATAAM